MSNEEKGSRRSKEANNSTERSFSMKKKTKNDLKKLTTAQNEAFQ